MFGVIAAFAIQLAATSPPKHAPPLEFSSACASHEQRQFDFWLGDWEVVDTATGTKAGHNLVTVILAGCGVAEHWTGVEGSKGTSLNAYVAGDRHWHQTWVDNQGGLLQLSGAFRDGRMTMSGVRTTKAGKTVTDRIVWTPLKNGSVRQVWDTSIDRGLTWRTVFDGTYVRH